MLLRTGLLHGLSESTESLSFTLGMDCTFKCPSWWSKERVAG